MEDEPSPTVQTEEPELKENPEVSETEEILSTQNPDEQVVQALQVLPGYCGTI